jgi:catechol 2,3-dioxygenase-like lactoylglutathione lyase family enzyme
MRLQLDHFNIVVRDMERSVAFYRDVLGLTQTFQATLEGEWIETVTGLTGTRARCVFFQLPGVDVRLELLEYLHPCGANSEENSVPNTIGLRHFAFETDDMEAFCARLQAANILLVSPPITVPFPVGNRGTKRLCYFHDPDGVLLEIAAYSQ